MLFFPAVDGGGFPSGRNAVTRLKSSGIRRDVPGLAGGTYVAFFLGLGLKSGNGGGGSVGCIGSLRRIVGMFSMVKP